MKNINIILLFLIGLLSFSCETTEIVEVDSPEVQTIVVEAEVMAANNFRGVRITHALPVGLPYDIKTAEIKNAYVYLKINGIKIVPLHYKYDGIYLPLHNDLLVKAGDTYELFATINDQPVYAKTKVPNNPGIISTRYNNAGFLEAFLEPESGEAYGAIWLIAGTSVKANDFYSIDKSPKNLSQTVSTRTKTIDNKYLSAEYNGKRYIQIFSFDSQFSDYFSTKVQDDPSGNSIVSAGSGVVWNIIGENVIGLFIGIAKGDATYVF
ncbi:MAG: hypothetical protein R6W90_14055 [Ignavibacteriaceae bacterium]